jgi:NosR/NirI family transcriptional regulator, nitrous oxide reductase regulator
VKRIIFIFVLFCGLFSGLQSQQQRFPKPEFQSGYEIPETTAPDPRAFVMEYVDLAVLLLVLAISIFFIFKKRSRKGILWTGLFSLAYFGFYREGCICAVGAVQNLSLAIFNNAYAIPITALAMFLIPLIVSLFYGRIFCATACPLGIIQDIFIVKPLRLPSWLQTSLGIIPFLYLGFAILFAATGSGFIICRYDPFVGFFRLGAEFHMIVLGILFLATGMFIARPYCRFICPYGALLNITSRFSRKHLSITPEDCISCHLCKDSCPFDAIDKPTEEKEQKLTRRFMGRFLWVTLLIPVLIFVGGWAISASYKTLSGVHPEVSLMRSIIADPEILKDATDIDVQTFLASGKTMDEVVENSLKIEQQYRTGGWWLGGFIGLVIGLTLLNQMTFRKRDIYEANRGSCYSCARCLDYCPVGKPEHPYHLEQAENAASNSKQENA